MEGDRLHAEGEFLVLFGLCREQLDNRVLETALVCLCSARENHEGGEYDIMILAAVQADVLSTTQHTLVVSGCWASFLMGIFAFKSAKVEVWFQLECASEQLVSMATINWHFYVATFFLWYPNLIICCLNMSYFRMIWTFAFGKCYGRGALNRFLGLFILIETRAVLTMNISPGVNIFMRWVFNFCLFWIFFLMVLACEMSNPGGGS